ncbi:nucleoside phosphorylase [Pollutibacter soli]|uniref:nucleoside phosphorylase n=1 Tax=Pollutibacter soli TaxID=3034157 RepID=UPI003013D757
MNRIGESELILNERGAMYHLDARPEEMADTIITVGDPGRVNNVSKHFDSIEYKCQHREFITHTGYIGKKRLSVVSTGIGPDNIDIVINELDALHNMDLDNRVPKTQLKSLNIIRVGTSGALQEDIPPDSFVVSTHGIGLDNLMHFYSVETSVAENDILQAFVTQTQLDNHLSYPYLTPANTRLMNLFFGGFHHGMTVTCPGFYGPQGRVLRLGLAQPYLVDHLTSFRYGNFRVTNFEMETAAIYGLGKALGHRCLSISSIVANRITKKFSDNPSKSIENLIVKTLTILAGENY